MRYTVSTVIKHTKLISMINDCPQDIQKEVKESIQTLLDETTEYQTTVNLTNLSSIISGVALYRVLTAHGTTREEFIDRVYKAMEPGNKEKEEKMNRIAKMPGAFSILAKLVPAMMTMGNNCGWHTDKTKRTKTEFGFDTTECLYHTLCKKYDLMDFGCAFCHNDEAVYSTMPGIRMERTGTLCRGADKCDFRFYKEEKRTIQK